MNSMHCSAKIQEWFAFHFSAGDDPATPSCLAPVEGLFNGIEAEWDLSFIATGAARYGSVFEQEISQPKPEPRYGLNMSTFFI